MKYKLIYYLTIFLTLSVAFPFHQEAFAQNKNISSQLLADSGQVYTYLPTPYFKNVNIVPYYKNDKQLSKIKRFEAANNFESSERELRDYISNFGIQNFYKDTEYIWSLAKVNELLGNTEKAKMYYRLVLKHHRNDIDIKKIINHYEVINKNTADLYVPLEYYYELVQYRQQVDTLIPPRNILLNMGNIINSSASDYAPTLNIHNDILIFTSKRNTRRHNLKEVINEDLFFSRGSGNTWETAQAFKSINTQYNEGSATISRDGKTIYFGRCDSPDSYGSCDLFVAELQADSTWGNIRNLGPNINSTGWDSHPSLSNSEDTLFFTSDRIGGFGLADIYFTHKDKKGNWMPAKNVGPVVNTRNNEVSPFVHPKHNILYFSSNGHLLNFGEFDIYKTYWQGSTWGEPVNIGPLVNGKGSEFYFTIDSESKNLYYAASQKENMQNLDLFSFPLPMGAQPLAITKIRGSLLDEETNQPFQGIVTIVDLDEGVEVAPKFLRADGSFDFDLIKDRNYLLVIQGDNFFRFEEMFHLDGDMEIHRKTQSISRKIEFTTIDFESGSARILTEMYKDLDKLSDFLIDHPNVKLVISGHTDKDGDKNSNLKLSQDRANAIMDYLVILNNVNAEQVKAIGYGSSKPIIKEEKTEEDKKLNRRVEFELIWGNEGNDVKASDSK